MHESLTKKDSESFSPKYSEIKFIYMIRNLFPVPVIINRSFNPKLCNIATDVGVQNFAATFACPLLRGCFSASLLIRCIR